jgi:hypothetical protein
MQKRHNWQSASENDCEAARRREKLIRPLVARGSITHNNVDAAATELGLSRSFMYKLLTRYRRRPQTSSSLFAKRGRPEHSRSLDQEREQPIQTAIHEFYLRRERPPMADLIKELCRLATSRTSKHPITGPSVSVFRPWMRSWLCNDCTVSSGATALRTLQQPEEQAA